MQVRVGVGRRRVLLASGSIIAFILGGSSTSAFADSCAITRTGPGTAATVSNPSGTTVNCINVQSNFTVTGTVSNAGTINANGTSAPTENGITVDNSSVGGGISNSGAITAANAGITIGTNQFVANNANLSGGITNSGTISVTGGVTDINIPAAGIQIINVTSASGTISNSGMIMGSAGGGAAGISLQQIGTFNGDIVNTGTIAAGQNQSGIRADRSRRSSATFRTMAPLPSAGPATVLACRSERSPAMSKTAGRSRRRAVSACP